LPAAFALLALVSSGALAEDKAPPAPIITAVTPLEIVPGVATTLHIRGLLLDTATEVRVTGVSGDLATQIKEKKKADLPNGLEAKDVGDTQVEATLTAPADLAPGEVKFRVVTPAGTTIEHSLRVAEASSLVDEKEPNNGFRNAQPIEFGETIRGAIQQDKDVDVFKFDGRAKELIFAEVRAARLGSLLDAVLTVYDSRGNVVATCDDAAGNRDPQLNVTLPADGKYYLSLQDANDRGGIWSAYELEVRETK
jgi:hypothetical protein